MPVWDGKGLGSAVTLQFRACLLPWLSGLLLSGLARWALVLGLAGGPVSQNSPEPEMVVRVPPQTWSHCRPVSSGEGPSRAPASSSESPPHAAPSPAVWQGAPDTTPVSSVCPLQNLLQIIEIITISTGQLTFTEPVYSVPSAAPSVSEGWCRAYDLLKSASRSPMR